MSLERSILVRFGSSNVFLTSSKACCVTFSSLSIARDLKFKKWNDRRTVVYNNSVSSKPWKNHGNVSSPRSLSSFIVLLLFMYHRNGESADNNTLQYYSNISFSCPNWHHFIKCFKQNNRIIGQIRPSTRRYEYKKKQQKSILHFRRFHRTLVNFMCFLLTCWSLLLDSYKVLLILHKLKCFLILFMNFHLHFILNFDDSVASILFCSL